MDFQKYYLDQVRQNSTKSLAYTPYFKRQVGGSSFYRGRYRQQGFGLAGILARLGRVIIPFVKPLAKRAMKAVGRQAITTGSKIALDMVNGVAPREAFQTNVKRGAKQMILKSRKAITEKKRPYKRKVRAGKVVSSKQPRRQKDIFD